MLSSLEGPHLKVRRHPTSFYHSEADRQADEPTACRGLKPAPNKALPVRRG